MERIVPGRSELGATAGGELFSRGGTAPVSSSEARLFVTRSNPAFTNLDHATSACTNAGNKLPNMRAPGYEDRVINLAPIVISRVGAPMPVTKRVPPCNSGYFLGRVGHIVVDAEAGHGNLR